MKTILNQLAILGLLAAVPSIATAGLGLCNKRSQCGDYCCAEQCQKECVGECKSVTVKRHCWNTECDEVCIPPVQLPCCKCLITGICGKRKCSGNKCSSCGSCGGAGCCENNCCQQDKCCKNSLLQRLFSKCAGCRVRCVSKLKKHDYECEENVVEWKVACCGGCAAGCCDNGALCAPSCSSSNGCQ